MLSPEQREKRRAYYYAHKAECQERHRRYREEHSEEIRLHKRADYKANRQRVLDRVHTYRKANVEAIRAKALARQATLDGRILHCMRTRVLKAMHGREQAAPTMALVGCSLEHLKAHLEGKFRDGMSWENYGFRGWHIDHIRPCASFDLTDPDQQRACFHWSNLLPLCQRCHLSIQARVDPWQPYIFEHSAWFKPYVAGFYAWKYLGEDITREQAVARIDDLLALERLA